MAGRSEVAGGGGWEDQRSRQTPSVELQGTREKTINITHRLREHCCWNLDSPRQGNASRERVLEQSISRQINFGVKAEASLLERSSLRFESQFRALSCL